MKKQMTKRLGRRAWWARGLLAGFWAAPWAACGSGGEASEIAARGPGGPGDSAERAVAVETNPVVQGSIARSITVSGIVEPIRTVGVNSRLSGALLSVEVEEGDRVEAGDVLARVDDREIAAQLASAEAAFDVARAAYERAERLHEQQIITLAEYERDQTQHAAARATRDQLRTRLEYATVRAPITGIVLEKRVEAGDVVATQTGLFTIGDVSTMVVRVEVSELDVVQLSVGDPVGLVLDAYPGRTVRGRIRRVFPAADPTTRLVPVEVAVVPGPDDVRVARPGFLARATFALTAREDVLLIPASALVTGAGAQAVFVIQDGRAIRRNIETGLTSEGRVEVVSGLTVGEQVVTAGNNMLRDGAIVRVVETGGTGGVETEVDGLPVGGAGR